MGGLTFDARMVFGLSHARRALRHWGPLDAAAFCCFAAAWPRTWFATAYNCRKRLPSSLSQRSARGASSAYLTAPDHIPTHSAAFSPPGGASLLWTQPLAGTRPSWFLVCSTQNIPRSEERRVGKECRSRWSRYQYKKKCKDKVSECVMECKNK